MDKVFQVANWGDFQHYKDRCPPWIKLPTHIFQDYNFMRLQDASKLLAICIWALASRTKSGTVPADFEYIKAQSHLGCSTDISHLKELVDAGFIIDASNVLAECEQLATPEKSRDRDRVEGFDSFWKQYPNKSAKQNAIKAWNKIPLSIYSELMLALEVQKSSENWTKQGGQFVPHAATWLNGKRWEDSIIEPANSQHWNTV